MRRAAPFFAFLVVLPGCYESFELPKEPDGGAVLVDSALPPPLDAGRPSIDAGRRDTGSSTGCTGETVPEYFGPGCSDATQACLASCTTVECTNECLTADPECVICFNQTIIACSNEVACQREWDVFACCAFVSCPEGGPGVGRLACATEGECLTELEQFALCADGEAFELCEGRINSCFER